MRELAECLQTARFGSAELDALINGALNHFDAHCVGWLSTGKPAGAAHSCSTNVSDALMLLPPDYNFSVGHRDGVFWAWAQPNDRWEPGDEQARHDHPGGSGLVVAHTAALALTSAAVILRLRSLDNSGEVQLP